MRVWDASDGNDGSCLVTLPAGARSPLPHALAAALWTAEEAAATCVSDEDENSEGEKRPKTPKKKKKKKKKSAVEAAAAVHVH